MELDDFGSGTSSKSTKLLHGGVRYLQKAILGLDRDQYKMVKEALYERAHVLHVAPHLAEPLPIMLPVTKYVHTSWREYKKDRHVFKIVGVFVIYFFLQHVD